MLKEVNSVQDIPLIIWGFIKIVITYGALKICCWSGCIKLIQGKSHTTIDSTGNILIFATWGCHSSSKECIFIYTLSWLEVGKRWGGDWFSWKLYKNKEDLVNGFRENFSCHFFFSVHCYPWSPYVLQNKEVLILQLINGECYDHFNRQNCPVIFEFVFLCSWGSWSLLNPFTKCPWAMLQNSLLH